MGDRYDDLAAAKAAAQQIADHYEQNAEAWRNAYAEGRTEDCTWHYRNAEALRAEARELVGRAQQQQQPRYTEGELGLMRDYPDHVRRNWNTAQIAANNLVMSKIKADPDANLWAYRNSGEYLATVAHALGITDTNGTESNEVASPNTALAASQSKYGEVTADDYNRGVQRLIEMKSLGYYRPENT
jgi:hypothetical protein